MLFATYRIQARDEADARALATDLCYEQTAELPPDLVPPGIVDRYVGRLLALQPAGTGAFAARIGFPADCAGPDLAQLLNLLYGNILLKPGFRLEQLELPASILGRLPGPQLGAAGFRALAGIDHRPLVCTALKPMGLTAKELAEQARAMALGGVDCIKDDHGLADQPMAPFAERVERVQEAIDSAGAATGRTPVYIPNVSGPQERLAERAAFAKSRGVKALMLLPGIQGLDSLRSLAASGLGLPILAHPAGLGPFVTSATSGIAHPLILGTLLRLAGADATVFPSFGGRFGFSEAECRAIAEACRAPLGAFPAILPAPGGGMTAERLSAMREAYGRDALYLVGGGLRRLDPDLTTSCRKFLALVEEVEQGREAGSRRS
jgi:ribulose-bisphosphate carboxylase large chain